MELTYAILAGSVLFALGFFLGIFYNRYKHSKSVKSISSQAPANTAAHQYLRFEKTFNFNGMIVDCHKQIAGGTYIDVFGVDPNKPESYNKFVIFPDLPERNATNFDSELDIKLKNFADIVKKQTGQDIFNSEYWTHLLILAAGVPFVACISLRSDGTLRRRVFSLARDDSWGPERGFRFLLPQLAVS